MSFESAAQSASRRFPGSVLPLTVTRSAPASRSHSRQGNTTTSLWRPHNRCQPSGVPVAVSAGSSWVIENRVVGVSDGDTITLLDDAKTQHKIRIAGIDAPEKGQAFGERSTQNLSALVLQKRIEARCHKKDRYSRCEGCALFVALSDAGLEQVRAGMAWWYREYAHEQATQERLV
jgi:endonuclease YncB( thermonuclease family)